MLYFIKKKFFYGVIYVFLYLFIVFLNRFKKLQKIQNQSAFNPRLNITSVWIEKENNLTLRYFQDSGLSKTLGENLKVFASYDPWVMNLIFSLIVAAATEVTSNTAMATLLMPILAQVVSLF